MIFFNNAFADSVSEIEVSSELSDQIGATEGANSLINFVPLIVIFVIFYFFIIRPQQRKMKEHTKMLSSIKKGDKVATAGGLIGVVVKVDNVAEILTIQVAPEVEMKVLKSSVAEIMNRSHSDDKK